MGICRLLSVSGVFAVALTALTGSTVLAQAPAAEQVTITWMRPLQKAATLLASRYAKPITYEDPVWLWRGEATQLGPNPNGKGALGILPRSLTVPVGLTPAETPVLDAARLAAVVEAYHAQNMDGPRFRVLESKLGLHIVPTAAHNANGTLVEAGSVLDARIRVPRASRTASEHVAALCQAVSAAARETVEFNDQWFDEYFAANGYLLPRLRTGKERAYMLFEWGADGVTAREALIDLLGGSSTTMTWTLGCLPGSQPSERFCFLSPAPLTVSVTIRGRSALTALSHDRVAGRPIPEGAK